MLHYAACRLHTCKHVEGRTCAHWHAKVAPTEHLHLAALRHKLTIEKSNFSRVSVRNLKKKSFISHAKHTVQKQSLCCTHTKNTYYLGTINYLEAIMYVHAYQSIQEPFTPTKRHQVVSRTLPATPGGPDPGQICSRIRLGGFPEFLSGCNGRICSFMAAFIFVLYNDCACACIDM